jgi:GGDEF domain-containing protein
LTGLPNRSVLEKALEEDAARPLSHPRTLICVNLSALYTISLRYGYQYHQRMLKEIGTALKSLCEGNDRLFHTMEHRFVFYVQDRSDEGALRDRSEQIWDALRPYLQAHGIGVSMGILQINEVGGADCEDLLGKLMITSEMAAANNHTDHSVLFYSPELDLRVARENEIIEEMIEIAEGIGSERLYLQYQPIFDYIRYHKSDPLRAQTLT